jgi:ATP-dependent helicase HrpA
VAPIQDRAESIGPEAEAYRWLLEEFRVSLFAQELGTAQPVSAIRLERQWARVCGRGAG